MIQAIPQTWRATIATWAASEPLIVAAYVFGSRAKGSHHAASDLDIALELAGADPQEQFTNWICEGERWKRDLSQHLPVDLDLNAINEGDETVGPAVSDHGICIYRRD